MKTTLFNGNTAKIWFNYSEIDHFGKTKPQPMTICNVGIETPAGEPVHVFSSSVVKHFRDHPNRVIARYEAFWKAYRTIVSSKMLLDSDLAALIKLYYASCRLPSRGK